eukprot:TRINITY_DN78952_c0_g1_i1.p1 TRINITY_DN78952_c0_g1~~TRINITY_DN78952_c0_g1_i1.p1  ORF type:complete len:281 (-),score=69.62 TRINITY_DN78952_c0_g1_i1:63-905(-)
MFKFKLFAGVSSLKAQFSKSIDEIRTSDPDWKPSWSVDKPVLKDNRILVISSSWTSLVPEFKDRCSAFASEADLSDANSSLADRITDTNSSLVLCSTLHDSELKECDEDEVQNNIMQSAFKALVAEKIYAALPETVYIFETQEEVGNLLAEKLDLVIHLLVEDQMTMLNREIFDWVVVASKRGYDRSHFVTLASCVLFTIMELPCPCVDKTSADEYELSWVHFLSMLLGVMRNCFKLVEDDKKKKAGFLRNASGLVRNSLASGGTTPSGGVVGKSRTSLR